ncbi:MAG: archaeosortase/exosortase family protein, partial [Puniceicoccales bacterium]
MNDEPSQNRAQSWANLLMPLVLWLILWSQHALEWTINDQYGYALFVPALGGYLLFRRWLDRPDPVPALGVVPVVIVLVVAIVLLYPLKVIFEANADWRIASWSQTLITFGVTLAFLAYWGGWPWLRHFAPAVIFWLFSIPWPTD